MTSIIFHAISPPKSKQEKQKRAYFISPHNSHNHSLLRYNSELKLKLFLTNRVDVATMISIHILPDASSDELLNERIVLLRFFKSYMHELQSYNNNYVSGIAFLKT